MSAIRDRLPRGGEGGATRGQQSPQRAGDLRRHQCRGPEWGAAVLRHLVMLPGLLCCSHALTARFLPDWRARVAEEDSIWSRDAEELAACFTVHARDLFGYACVLTDADRPLAGDLVQAAFEAAAAVWGTLRDLPAGQRYDWLRDTLAAAAERQTGHPAGQRVRLPGSPAAHPAEDGPLPRGLRRRGGPGPVRGLAADPGEQHARERNRTHTNDPLLTVFTPPGYPRIGGLAVRTEPAQPPRRRVTVTR